MENSEDYLNYLKEKTWWCPRLFDHIYTNTSGEYTVCCVGGPNPQNVSNTKPIDWYFGDTYQSCRRAALGLGDEKDILILEHQCRRCIEQEKTHGQSERIQLSEKVDPISEVVKITDSFCKTGKPTLQENSLILQFRQFGNTCNLDCYMCQPHNSSVREKMTLKNKYQKMISFDENDFEFKGGNKKDQKDFLDNIEKLVPYTRMIVLQGGEPFLLKKQFEYLDKIVESDWGAEDISLEMNSNLTVLGSENKSILDYVKHFKRMHINISLDGVGKYNEYIRRRSLWKDIMYNYNLLKEYENIDIEVFSTISLLSILRFEELEKWCNENNLHQRLFVVDDPKELHPKNLPDKIKNKLKSMYINNEMVYNSLLMDRNEDEYNKAIKYIRKTDEQYKTNLFEIYPELA